jgi:glycosyltransferase involved in cell wall biosynthesis
MRVAVVFHDLDPTTGGGFTFQQSLIEAIDAARERTAHTFDYFTTGDADPGGRFTRIPSGKLATLRQRGLEMTRDVQDARLGIRPVRARGWLDRQLADGGAELVWFASSYAEDVDLPYIFTVWDVEYMRQPWFPEVSRSGEWELRDRYYTRYLTKATRVIVPNLAGTGQLLRYYRLDPERILELHHPTPPIAEHGRAPSEDAALVAAAGVREPFIFYPAQFWAHKNHGVLIDTLSAISDLQLALVGSDKGGAATVRALAEKTGVADRVHFLGFVPVEVLVALYRRAEALVYPSLFGPENLPPLEAFALGCPVIASAIPGAAEQMGDAALLVSPVDSRAYAEAITRVRSDSALREQLASAGRRRADEFSPDAYVDGVIGFLDQFEQIRRSWA